MDSQETGYARDGGGCVRIDSDDAVFGEGGEEGGGEIGCVRDEEGGVDELDEVGCKGGEWKRCVCVGIG